MTQNAFLKTFFLFVFCYSMLPSICSASSHEAVNNHEQEEIEGATSPMQQNTQAFQQLSHQVQQASLSPNRVNRDEEKDEQSQTSGIFQTLQSVFYKIQENQHITSPDGVKTPYNTPVKNSKYQRYTQNHDITPGPIPLIEQSGWGFVSVICKDEDEEHTYVYPNKNTSRADILIYPHGCDAWNWTDKKFRMERERHVNPGITEQVVDYLLAKDADIKYIILTKGYQDQLKMGYSALYLEKNTKKNKEDMAGDYREKGLTILHLNTYKAVTMYNMLVQKGHKVAMAAHFTC